MPPASRKEGPPSGHQRKKVSAVPEIELYVNGERIALNRFTANVLRDVLMAFLRNLHGVEVDEIKKIEVS